jgi:hypothetical protein
MGTIALESKTTRRPALVWLTIATAAILVAASALVLTLSSPHARSTGRTTRSVASDSHEIVVAGPTATGRPRAYHSQEDASCSKFTTLPKRGKVCLQPREEAPKKAR